MNRCCCFVALLAAAALAAATQAEARAPSFPSFKSSELQYTSSFLPDDAPLFRARRGGSEGVTPPGSHIKRPGRALDDYVAKLDGVYDWVQTGEVLNGTWFGKHRVFNWVGYVLNLTSLSWLEPSETNRPIWSHQLVVIVPEDVEHTTMSAVYATGGYDDNHVSNKSIDVFVTCVLACTTQSVGSVLFQIPNEPIVFSDDPKHSRRVEGALLDYSWFEFMKNQSRPELIALFPMTKAVVRAMDAVTDFAAQKLNYAHMEHFIVAGASKRGWTTWLTGAVDTRVVGIVPIVMDLLNFEANLKHMYRAYGGWSFVLGTAYEMNFTTLFGTQEMAALSKMMDPLTYKETLDMPKLVVNAGGDEFFLPDNDHWWWGELPGETKRLIVSNAEHSMITGLLDVLIGVGAFYKTLLVNGTRPSMDWTIDNSTGEIVAWSDTEPELVELKFASTWGGERRDFRLIKGNTKADPCTFIPVHVFGFNACVNPVIWWGETIAPANVTNPPGKYVFKGSQPLPADGWRAFLLEFTFPFAGTFGLKFTTQISIIPNTFPYPECFGAGCKGVLV